MKAMMDALVAPGGALAGHAGSERFFRSVLFVVGRGESHVEEIAQPVYSTWLNDEPPIETTILASPGQVELHLTTRSMDAVAAEQRLVACARPAGRGTGSRRVQHRRPLDGRDPRTAPAGAQAHDRRRGVVHGRADDVASHGCSRKLRVRRRWRRRVQQRVEDRAGWRRSGAHRGARRSQRTGRGRAR